VADVRPFRAVRYARPTAAVTAPPYDVIDDESLAALRARDPHNVVHLTLEPDGETAGRRYREWLAEGVLVREDDPAVWWIEQDSVGPDGVARRREGVLASLRVEPYETGSVLPHEQTHAGPIEGRLRLVRAAGAQLEPIFLLYDGPPVAPPERKGFGHTVISQMVASSLRAQVALDYAREGLSWTLDAPISSVTETSAAPDVQPAAAAS
jgi:hypothetical protein